jgi:excisionase family DNA binding protein
MKEIKKTIPFSEAKSILQISRDISLMRFIKKVNIKITTKAESGLAEILLDQEDFCRALKIDELPEKFLTTQEAADLLNISVSKIKSLCGDHNLPFYRLDDVKGSKLLFVESELIGDSTDISLVRSAEFYLKTWKFNQYEEFFLRLFNNLRTHGTAYDRNLDVVRALLINNDSFEKVSDEFGVGIERINYSLREGLKKLGEFAKNVILENEVLKKNYTKLEAENAVLRELVREANREIPEVSDHFSIKIKDLGFSIRTLNCLRSMDDEVFTLGELASRSISELKKIRNFGSKALCEIEETLETYNLKLREE